jgi:flagellar hook capping protein FlgD
MPRASFWVSALLFLWAVSAAAKPAPLAWNLASPDDAIRVIQVIPAGEKAPELEIEWPATKSLVPLDGGKEAWIWEVDRSALPVLDRYMLQDLAFPAPLADVICFGCTEEDEIALARVIGKPSSSDQDPDTLHPYSPIALMISNATAYPNPFNPFTDDATLSVTLSEDADMTITAYDWDGKFVATVFKGPWIIGVNQTLWSGQTEDGRKLGNGVYFLRVVARSGTRQEEQVLKVAVWNER